MIRKIQRKRLRHQEEMTKKNKNFHRKSRDAAAQAEAGEEKKSTRKWEPWQRGPFGWRRGGAEDEGSYAKQIKKWSRRSSEWI